MKFLRNVSRPFWRRGLKSLVVLTILTSLSMEAAARLTCLDVFLVDLYYQRPTEVLREEYQQFAKVAFWRRWIDDELDFRRFVRSAHYDKWKDTKNGSEMYGIENYKAFRLGSDFLDEIPVGEFRITQEILEEAHRKSSEGITKLLKTPILKKMIPAGYLPTEPGVLKKRLSFGRDPLFAPITDDKMRALQSNPWLGNVGKAQGFLEVPFLSKPNARRGIILYSRAGQTKEKIAKLSKWYDEMAAKVRRGEADPIEVAAEVQWALVSIHPFIDGNGRLSRLIMDRVLREFGLPPSLVRDSSDDIYMSAKDWARHVREGVAIYNEIAAEMKLQNREAFELNRSRQKMPLVPSLSISGLLRKDVEDPHVAEELWPATPQQEVMIAGQPYVLLRDGFLYNHRSIPHAFHDNRLYPISDRAYGLYEWGGEMDIQPPRVAAGATRRTRDYSRAHIAQFAQNLRMVRAIEAEQVDGKKIAVEPYERIREANENGELFLYPWQKRLLAEAAKIRETDPYDVLIRKRGSQTSFESVLSQGFVDDRLHHPSTILAQYLKVDRHLWDIQKAAEKIDMQVAKNAFESRKKVHAAARTLLKDYLSTSRSAPPETLKLLEKDPGYRLFHALFEKSPLRFETLEEAIQADGDDTIVLMRADHMAVRILGFRSQESYQELARRLPGYDKFSRVAHELHKELADSDKREQIEQRLETFRNRLQDPKTTTGVVYQHVIEPMLSPKLQARIQDLDKTMDSAQTLVRNLAENILRSRYADRGVAEEFERLFVDYFLQMRGIAAAKAGVSFTSRSQLLSPDDDSSVPFTTAGLNNGIHLVRLKKTDIVWNDYSTYSAEYEFVLNERAGPRAILQSFRPKDLINTGSRLSDEARGILTKMGFPAPNSRVGGELNALDPAPGRTPTTSGELPSQPQP